MNSGSQSYRFAAPADKALDVKIQVETLEAGDPILFVAPSENIQVDAEPKILEKPDNNAPILGIVHERSYYEALIKSANTMTLEDILLPK